MPRQIEPALQVEFVLASDSPIWQNMMGIL